MTEPKHMPPGPCPFCHRSGGTVSVDWEAENGRPAALYHSLPTCETYDRLTADEFVRAVIERRHYQ